jgi:drug/metabolite transporter (DMT)-like permease
LDLCRLRDLPNAGFAVTTSPSLAAVSGQLVADEPATEPLQPSAGVATRRGPLLLALAAVYIVWGSTYLAMRIAVEGLPPMLMGAVRFSIAGAILMAYLASRGHALPTVRQWIHALPVGGLLFVGGNGLVAIAEQSISSGIATMPLWMALLALASGERPRRREWLGLAVGFAGVVALSSGAELRADLGASIVLLLSPLSWAIGSLLARRLPMPSGLMAAAAQMLAGGALLFVVSAARGERWPAAAPLDALLAVIYLIVFGSLIAFTAYSWLLRHARPAVATSYAYVNPALAVLLGAALGAEQVGWATLVATPLIVAAVAVIVLGKK